MTSRNLTISALALVGSILGSSVSALAGDLRVINYCSHPVYVAYANSWVSGADSLYSYSTTWKYSTSFHKVEAQSERTFTREEGIEYIYVSAKGERLSSRNENLPEEDMFCVNHSSGGTYKWKANNVFEYAKRCGSFGGNLRVFQKLNGVTSRYSNTRYSVRGNCRS